MSRLPWKETCTLIGFDNRRTHRSPSFFPLGAGAVVEISTSSKATAILLLPDGGSRTNLRRLQVFRDYALKNAQRWYAFVNGTLGRMVESGELYLVTGVDKSSSWSVAALENNSEGRGLSLTLKAAQAGSGSAACAWEWESSSSFANSGPRRGPEEQSWTDNQTVFLRGFKVAIRSTPLKKAIKVLSIADLKPSQILSRDRFIPFSSARSSDGRSGFYRSNTSRSASGDQDTISESSKVCERSLSTLSTTEISVSRIILQMRSMPISLTL